MAVTTCVVLLVARNCGPWNMFLWVTISWHDQNYSSNPHFFGPTLYPASVCSTLKGLVGDLIGTDWYIILRAKSKVYWLNVGDNTVAGTVFSSAKFRYLLCARYTITHPNLQSKWYGCVINFDVRHPFSCSKVGLVIAHHNEVRDELLYLNQRAFT